MSDLIRRSDALAAFAESTSAMPEKQGRRRIEEIPAVDAVEVVRCRECKNWNTDWEPNYFNPDNPMYYCAETDLFLSGDWFCAGGQRREDGDA